MKKIKVLHINTFLKGGAFQAAVRLHYGLMKLEVESNFLGFSGKGCSESKIHLFSHLQFLLFKIAVRLRIPINQAGKNTRLLPSKKKDYEVYSFPTSDFDLTKHPLVREADIIHLHWVNNFLDYPTFFKKIDKPIVWTLHDMNLFQGGFHYMDDQNQNANLFQELDQKIISLKHEALDHIPNLQIVCPSKWLKTASENAQLTLRFSHYHIYNGLDLNCFKPAEPDLLRRKYDLPQDKILLLFVSEKLGNKRKGFDLLLPAIQSMVHRSDISFLAIGELDQSLKESNITELGYIQNEEKMAEIYAAADAVILPSREDNLPNVMLEALACGTPVIAFPIGGIPEVVKTGHTGILAEEVSVEALKTALLSFAGKKIVLDRQKIRAFAVEHFDLAQQAKKYLEVYEQALDITAPAG